MVRVVGSEEMGRIESQVHTQNFLKRRNSNGQKTHEKMFTIPSNKGNAN
jgi:hypothetical protein